MLVGDTVGDFEVVDQFGSSVTLGQLLESGPLVLYFYIKAMTPGWTIESKHFRDLKAEFAELGATIVGISSDRSDRQKQFDDQNELGFPLLSDSDKTVAKQFGVKRPGPLPTKRATFVIDTDRSVLGVITSELSMDSHADDALAILRNRS
jgi:thioredoxin-dependent peroxiredoxin